MMDRPMPQSELAVFTGDIVGSSRLDARALDAALAALRRAAEGAAGWSGGAARFTRYRGDGWQCIGPATELALRTALYLRAQLRAEDRRLDTRLSIGIGPGVMPPGEDLAAARGPAFEASGRGLEDMGHAPRFAIDWSTPPAAAAIVKAMFSLADELSRRWTSRQAEVFVQRLTPGSRSQAELAASFGISQQMVAKHLAAGGDWALQRAIAAAEGAP